MTIILDENRALRLAARACAASSTTVQLAGYGGVKNGELLAVLEGAYDVFLTGDKNLRYQQNLAGEGWPSSNYPPTAGLPCARFVRKYPSG